MEPIIFNPETETKFKKLKRFLSEGTGYTFATATDQRLIPEINKQLQTALPNTHILFFAENDIQYIEQIRQAAEACQALIVMDIGELIRKNEYFIYTLNFAREEINAIGKPILFWMSNATLTKIANQANDLYSQRFYTNLHFEQKLPVAALDKSFDDLLNTFEPDSEKQNRLSSIKVLEHQLAAHTGEKAAVAQSIALPLALKYAEDEQREQAMSVLNEYDEYLNKTNARVLFDIAKIYELTYNATEAIKYYEQALHYTESEELKGTINNEMGLIWKAKGDLDKAIDYITKALAIDIKLFDEENQKVATYYNNLGIAWQAKGDLDKAIDYYTKALAIDIKLFGDENPNVAIRYNNLGLAWQDKGDLDKAIDYYTKALAIDIKLFGEENPNVAIYYNNLGSAWEAKGDLDKAIDYITKALAIDIKLFGEENPNVAIDYNNLGMAWQAKGDLDKAIYYLEKSYSIYLKLYGADNPSTQTVKENLDYCIAAMKK